MKALQTVGGYLLAITVLLGFVFLGAFWLLGVTWVSVKIVGYVSGAAVYALLICLLVLLPMSVSLIFGLYTWIFGVLAIAAYWGGPGLIAGLLLGPGIVPVGILASIFSSDWTSAGVLTFGLVITCGSRLFALRRAIFPKHAPAHGGDKIDKAEAEKFWEAAQMPSHA